MKSQRSYKLWLVVHGTFAPPSVTATSPLLPTNVLPTHVLAALQNGNKLEAVKLLCEATGLGLMESKNAIEEYDNKSCSNTAIVSAMSPLPSSVVEVLRQGSKMEAVNLLREKTGLRLNEAKDWGETASPEVHPEVDRDAPGEVSASRNLVWYVVATNAVVALIVYCTLRISEWSLW